ncbi:magnesium chelatase subunit D [Roseovarius sp. LXJ103]|uniref:magnesium chelatase subunit D n=1 Tax=Roseovarius carneus TaxID=2853164 RepID=UPI000D61DED0|nr:magnesium chelatase subunit D [Roseovarius carneus]MBZ8119116.1 magnesium chelatase subunit D [Roseovarius carneus]PWE35248.1 magnesium chelatase ATPase subunit D [Pelagicola sp. LXJ1103]
MSTLPETEADRAALAIALVQVDASLGGLHLRARSGPVRDSLVDIFGPALRLGPGASEDQIFGGLDVTETLAKGRTVERAGLLEGARAMVLTSAERLRPHLAARLSQALGATPLPVLALDEGIEEGEGIAPALSERLAFYADLDGLGLADIPGAAADEDDIIAARNALPRIALPEDAIAQIATMTVLMGISSARAGHYALRAARALAALDGAQAADADHLAAAIALTCGHRATQIPQMEEPPEEEAPPPDTPEEPEEAPDEAASQQESDIPEELLLAAVMAQLPKDILSRMAQGNTRRASGSGAGAKRKGGARGRPLPARPGRLDGRTRLDLVATLRAAAPWQTMRRKAMPDAPAPIHVRPSDIHTKRYEDSAERLLIFTVDASGSAAMARLGEAKGAVELLLAEAYARRDHVALIAFRGAGADLMLPPTRSLVQTKRRLAGLPGGGGTPLASGLMAAEDLAEQARGRGMTPTIALITDGRANIGLDGQPGRAQAGADATKAARRIMAAGTAALVIDAGNRPTAELATLSTAMGAQYLALPRADAQRLSRAARAALDA